MMAQQAEVFIKLKTTRIMLVFRFFVWLGSLRLLRLLDNCIFARVYVNGKLSNELRFSVDNNQIIINGDFPGGEIEKGSDIKP